MVAPGWSARVRPGDPLCSTGILQLLQLSNTYWDLLWADILQYRFFRRKTGFCKCFLQFVFEALVILTLKRSVYSNKHLKHVTSILQHFYLQIVRCSQKESSAHLGLLYIYVYAGPSDTDWLDKASNNSTHYWPPPLGIYKSPSNYWYTHHTSIP